MVLNESEKRHDEPTKLTPNEESLTKIIEAAVNLNIQGIEQTVSYLIRLKNDRQVEKQKTENDAKSEIVRSAEYLAIKGLNDMISYLIELKKMRERNEKMNEFKTTDHKTE